MISFFLKQKIHFFVLLLFIIFSAIFSPSLILAQGDSSYGIDATLGELEKQGQGGALEKNEDLATTAGTLVGTILTWTGVFFFILIFAGGITWMTAQGNEQQVEKAKNIIIAATFGLIIVLSAYAITAYIGGTLTE